MLYEPSSNKNKQHQIAIAYFPFFSFSSPLPPPPTPPLFFGFFLKVTGAEKEWKWKVEQGALNPHPAKYDGLP